jgi:hypothetical protein
VFAIGTSLCSLCLSVYNKNITILFVCVCNRHVIFCQLLNRLLIIQMSLLKLHLSAVSSAEKINLVFVPVTKCKPRYRSVQIKQYDLSFSLYWNLTSRVQLGTLSHAECVLLAYTTVWSDGWSTTFPPRPHGFTTHNRPRHVSPCMLWHAVL